MLHYDAMGWPSARKQLTEWIPVSCPLSSLITPLFARSTGKNMSYFRLERPDGVASPLGKAWLGFTVYALGLRGLRLIEVFDFGLRVEARAQGCSFQRVK